MRVPIEGVGRKFRRKAEATEAPAETTADAPAETSGQRPTGRGRSLRRLPGRGRRRRARRPRLRAGARPSPTASCGCRSTRSSGQVRAVMLAGSGRGLRVPGLRRPAQRRPVVGRPAADRRGHDPPRRSGHRARGPLGHRAGLPDAGHSAPTARPRRSPRGSSASTATAGCCAPRSSAVPRSSPTPPRSGRTRSPRSSYAVATQAMPVGEPLPVKLPDDARRVR